MVIIMGLAGAGKGTQAKMLANKDGYHLISTGDLLRQYASAGQKARMLKGVLLKDAEIYSLINKALENTPHLKKCLIDGTPRSIPQAKWLIEQMVAGRFSIDAVLHLEVSEKVVRRRLLARGRSDDTEVGISKRFQEYYRATLPILEYFKQHNIPVDSIDADQPVEVVHKEILQILGQR